MKEPPQYLMSLMHDIEVTVIEIWREFNNLVDKDVEWVYDQLKKYYKSSSSNEPLSSSDRGQALIDEILNLIEDREESEVNKPFINNPKVAPGGRYILTLDALYVMAFGKLTESTRFWRKEHGPVGYLSFIAQHVI